ncbi:MAG: efflux RND transporter permease subunit, partial [Acidimicrobiales bacterium]
EGASPEVVEQDVTDVLEEYLNTIAGVRSLKSETTKGMAFVLVEFELGVDIGGLDATVLAGFPGTISSMWQQAGRSGRSGRPGISVLVAGDDQLDRWYVRHPDQLLDRAPEPAVINPDNQQILLPHLRCAAQELPLGYSDEALWPTLDDGVRALAREDSVWIRHRSGSPLAVWSTGRRPQHRVGLRSSGGGQIRITNQGVLVGTVDAGRAARDVHPGAIYLHQGQSYRVVQLDLGQREARVEPDEGDRSTQPRSETTLRVLEVDARRALGPVRLGVGTVEVERRVVGYTERDAQTGEPLDHHELELPAHHLVTRGVWLECSPSVTIDLEADRLGGSLHALEHAAIGLLPLFTICDRWDVGGVSTPHLADLGCAAVVIYDAYAGGVGIAELAYHEAEALLAATVGVIESCDCDDGCPSCVQSPKCGNGNDPLDKHGALVLLDRILANARERTAS